MKRKAISVLLTVVMAVTFIPVGLLAQTETAHATTRTQADGVAWANARYAESWAVDMDGQYGVQCVDLILAYYDYLGVSRSSGNAYQYASNALPAGWQRTNTPQAGDIVVWGPGAALADGGYKADSVNGHIGIVTEVRNSSTIITIETNTYEGGKPANVFARYSTTASCYIRPNWASGSANNPPQGSFRVATGGEGKVYVGGWAYDPDDMSKQIAVDVYIGGPCGDSNAEGHRITANSSDFTEGSGANHGFSAWVETNKTGSNVPVYCYAVDTSMTSNVLLSGTCLYVDITAPTYAAFDVNWSIDGTLYGGNQSIATVDVYIDGQLIANDCNDYANLHNIGARYQITDIKAISGYTYVGADAALSGTLPKGGVVICLQFVSESGNEPCEIQDAWVTLSPTEYKYDGSQKTPSVSVVKTDGTVLAEGTDYTVAYPSSRSAEGTYTVTITGIGDYKGSVKKTFSISSSTHQHTWIHVVEEAGLLKNGWEYDKCEGCGTITNIGIIKGYAKSYVKSFKVVKGKKSFTAKWAKQSKANQKKFDGYQIRYSLKSNMSGAKYKTALKSSYSKKIKNLKSKKKYYVQVRTFTKKNGTTFYSKWSTRKSVKTN